jgi:hypothetical protein
MKRIAASPIREMFIAIRDNLKIMEASRIYFARAIKPSCSRHERQILKASGTRSTLLPILLHGMAAE